MHRKSPVMLYSKFLSGNLWVVEIWCFIFAFQYLITFYNECMLLHTNKGLFLIGERLCSGRGFLERLLPNLIFFKGGNFLIHHIDLKKKQTTFYCGKFQTDPSADRTFIQPNNDHHMAILVLSFLACTFSFSVLF